MDLKFVITQDSSALLYKENPVLYYTILLNEFPAAYMFTFLHNYI
jgi:hypothetical protein